MINPINTGTIKKPGKGGLWAKIGGGLAAAIAGAAAPFTAGTSLAAVPAALGAAGVGAGVAGTLLNKGSKVQSSALSPLDTVSKTDPGLQMATLTSAQQVAINHPDFSADQAKQVFDYLDQAKQKLNERLNLGA